MCSKEKPKKIGVIGTDKNVYNFLLKCDTYGDLRKEQRFIEFAGLCNKMLEMDSEASKRNLRLRTYAIVPLSRNTGLIEWINNTTTLKSVVGEYWKKQNIKGEMNDIKRKAQELNMGETHTKIWTTVKNDVKPVLGNWFADHYLVPDIWYEARLNFTKSTAIWSMIGYVIGLGDRHGDNILIHQHTGEVTHVDFDCIFEKGAKLKIPEIVPFRLT
jgi:phosphatidylinositol kinase/protein kinase (PI-3  family)